MAKLTPMMQQYLDMKEKYSDCLLFFRLGDFYEMFFDDAKTASKELELVLTGRDCGLSERAPMCGVPYHSVNSYINKLINKGYKVAICEQLTDPSLSQGLVERDVIRVITPGTVIEEQLLNDRQNNYIAAILKKGSSYALSYCDVSTGELCSLTVESNDSELDTWSEINRISPHEIILNVDTLGADSSLYKNCRTKFYVTEIDSRAYDVEKAEERLLRHFRIASLQCFSIRDMSYEVGCIGALVGYLEQTQKNALSHIEKITKIRRSEFMGIDTATRVNLELTRPLKFDGSKSSTLLYVLDKTKTSMGGRLLRRWIDAPLQIEHDINSRLDAVDNLVNDMKVRGSLREVLADVYDIERLCSRIAYGTISPRDCRSLCLTLEIIPKLKSILSPMTADRIRSIAAELDCMEDICQMLSSAIADEPPISAKDGGLIRDGYNKEIDSLRDLAKHGKDWISQFEAAEKERTGIRTLKIGFNRVFGYYIEVSKSFIGSVPLDYQRRQTLANSERYITPALKETEERLLTASDRCIALEYELFLKIRETLSSCLGTLKNNAQLIAEIDAYHSLAFVAAANDYSRPKINTKGKISIIEGRHPVVENSMKGAFVPNSTELNMNSDRIVILTGPNMAGKSTYMRQVAIIVLMAHIGSFVPAKSANICVTDRIFTRVGASDSLSTGQSTFMVEMSEMANILNNATDRSLVIIDEIGRGTSTFDGLSIAWAVLEFISDKEKCGAKTLFATHYHELTELEGKLDGVKNYRINVKEIGEDIVFLRKIVRGGADKSFGIHVAKLAGLPESLIRRANAILSEIEASDINHAASRVSFSKESSQVSLLGDSTDEHDGRNAVIDELASIDANKLTPLEALSKLYELSTRVKMLK